MRPDAPVLVAGAGIGGLALAAGLRHRGLPVRVFERAPTLETLGAGITMQANAMAAFARLGLEDTVRSAGAVLPRAEMRSPDGVLLTAVDLARLQQEVGHPFVGIHRARLHAALREAAGDVVRLGAAVRGFADSGAGVRVELEDGSKHDGAVLVGADGLRSAVRRQLLGDGEPRYHGYTSWRGVARDGALAATISATCETWGKGERFGVVPIGHGELYWFACADAPQGEKDAADPRAALLERFGRWHAPITDVLRATRPEELIRTDIFDRDPVRTWHKGRVALLGDAAHPMTPNLGQGGCQAVEDADVLCEVLATSDDVELALRRYETARVQRANHVVEDARRFGAVAHWSSGPAVWLRTALVKLAPAKVAYQRFAALQRLPTLEA